MIGVKGGNAGAPRPASGGMFSRGPGGILPERGSQLQYDMVNSLIQSAMSSAGRSNSPVLAALTPLIGGALMSRTSGLRDMAQERERGGALESMYGKLSPEQLRLYEASTNEALPDFMRADARGRLRASLGLGGGGSGGAGGSGGTAGQEVGDIDPATIMFRLQSGQSLDGAQQRWLVEVMTSGESAQQREWARDLLAMNDQNIIEGGAPAYSPAAAPNVSTETPSLGGPSAPRSPSAIGTPPPPPPGTVPY